MDERIEKLMHRHEPLEPKVGQLTDYEFGMCFNRSAHDVGRFRNVVDSTESLTDMSFERQTRQSREYWDRITKRGGE